MNEKRILRALTNEKRILTYPQCPAQRLLIDEISEEGFPIFIGFWLILFLVFEQFLIHIDKPLDLPPSSDPQFRKLQDSTSSELLS